MGGVTRRPLAEVVSDVVPAVIVRGISGHHRWLDSDGTDSGNEKAIKCWANCGRRWGAAAAGAVADTKRNIQVEPHS